MRILIHWLISGLAVLSAAYILPGVHVSGIFAALIVALVLGIINASLKPVILLLTLPINLLTLGLFTLVINGLLILLAASIVPGFRVDGFLWAFLFSIVLSIINYFLFKLL
ncbi:phage holin family protein [Candidatus Daviesbacteria bacterium]|nr:phage holin family protein [Candidatus Daviesbacteria bacterium]